MARENQPTDEALWQEALNEARSRFDVYPSAYASQWAVKWYNDQGGGWRKTAKASYDHINFKPPAGVASAAKKGLEYRQKASPSNRGGLTPSEASKEGIGSGVQRATNLKNRDTVSPKVVKQMKAFFARHQKNKSVAAEHKNEPWNDKGYVSWLLWGGDAGQAWAEKVVGQMEAADKKTAAVKVAPDVQKMLNAVGGMLGDAQRAFPGSKFTRQPMPVLRYKPGTLPPELEGRFVKLHADLMLPQMAGNKARLEFALHDAYTAFTAERMSNPPQPIQPDGRYRLIVNPTGFNDRAEWDKMAKLLRPFKVAPKSNVDRTTRQVAAIADKIAKVFVALGKAREEEGPFNRMSDSELNSVIGEWKEQGPENFWQDGELDMTERQAYAYYRRQWRAMKPSQQKTLLEQIEGLGSGRWAARVAARYLRRAAIISDAKNFPSPGVKVEDVSFDVAPDTLGIVKFEDGSETMSHVDAEDVASLMGVPEELLSQAQEALGDRNLRLEVHKFAARVAARYVASMTSN